MLYKIRENVAYLCFIPTIYIERQQSVFESVEDKWGKALNVVRAINDENQLCYRFC